MATLVVFVFLWLPLGVVVLFSFHKTASLAFPFTGFSLRWYDEVLASPELRTAARNSFVVASCVAISTLVFGTAAAYQFTRMTGRIPAVLAALLLLPITLPGLFIGVSLLAWFDLLDVQLSLTTIVAAHLVFVFPYFVLLAGTALDRLDPALIEAAEDLGASTWTSFRRVTLPQVWPVLIGATMLCFALSFDEFIITFFVTGGGSTLPLYIWSSLRRTVDPSINTISTLLLAVTILITIAGALLVRGLAGLKRDDRGTVR